MKITLNQLYNEFYLLPIGKDKSPNFSRLNGGWKQYQTKKIELEKLQNSRLGVICGATNLEVIDIDNHFGDADKLYQYIADNFELEKFPVIGTIHKGFHIYYRCKEIEGNQKLATRLNDQNKYETLVETRGIGGYVVFYNNIINGDILNVPTITPAERDMLLEICRSLDENIENPIEEQKTKKEQKPRKEFKVPETHEKPGDAYNNDPQSVEETKLLLKSNGWQEFKGGFWKRPNKATKGISATFQRRGKNKFYVFSSNAAPFEPETSYSMFAVKTILEYNGDFSACAKELSKKYNIKPLTKKNASKQKAQGEAKKTQGKAKKNKYKDYLNPKWQALFDILENWKIEIRYNELTKIVDYKQDNKWKNDIETLLSDIIYEMENNYAIKSISKAKLSEMIMTSHIAKNYNPITYFYNNLPKWNGKNNIELLCEQIVLANDEDEKFFDTMFKKHLIRTLRCALELNYTNRLVFVLHGKQNIGKTKIWEWLIPAELYYDEPINLNDKDSYIALSRYLTINFDDLDQLSKKEVAKLKSYISKGNVSKRLPYARTETKMTRISSFVGTTNISDILADNNNTRWLIMKVKSFNWKNYIKNIDPLQIWAQIKELYLADKEAGELTIEEQQKRDYRNNSKFLEINQEREILLKYFTEDSNATPMTATDISIIIEKELRPLKIHFWKLTTELKRLFGEPIHTTFNGRTGRYYYLSYDFYQMENQNTWINQEQKEDKPF